MREVSTLKFNAVQCIELTHPSAENFGKGQAINVLELAEKDFIICDTNSKKGLS